MKPGQAIIWVLMGLGVCGCVNVDLDKPLVDLGTSNDQVQRVHDPAPGVPDAKLTHEQQLQRDLAITQDRLMKTQRDLQKEETKRHMDKKKYEREKDELKDRIEALEKANERLRKLTRARDDD